MSLLTNIAFTAFSFLVFAQPAMATHNQPGDVADLHDVVEKFRASIIGKDKETFVGLFYSDDPGHVVWRSVTDDARVARIQKTKPEERKAHREPESNYLTFIDGIAKPGAKPREEIFRDIVVDTDGEIASVNFDYSYLADGKETNWGREMWHLVRTEDGWKIISVIYSVRDPVSRP
ncbi:nuclear transport factor 2 family protein [Pseudoxanthomonas sp.]|jgi:hypothetical protein|uniref:nuclear transport factor 2 family protein n=1 Tax=Pseudoxanthomonas sp. TaxID=1871049 RepID=UPI002FE08E49